MRVTCSVQRKKRKDKILKLAKGFYGRTSKCYGLAIDHVKRKFKYEYRDRRNRKRQMRSLWIQRLSAAAKMAGLKCYSVMIHKLKTAGCLLNRKMLSEIAARNFNDFLAIIKKFIPESSITSELKCELVSMDKLGPVLNKR